MVLISLYTKLSNVGGAQKMCISIHQGLRSKMNFEEEYISSETEYNNLNDVYINQIESTNYLRFNAYQFINRFNDAIIISHHRKLTAQLVFWSKILKKSSRIIHIAHNEFYSYKWLTFFPKNVIAVSKGVKTNHKNYFKLKKVHVIYNGLPRPNGNQRNEYSNIDIKVLMSGRIDKVKQQIEIVEVLKNKIPKNIQLWFAGTGEMYKELLEATKNESQIRVLGHIDDMESLCASVDYIMLCSLKEGMPLSLIEGASFGLPILCNDVGGNMEILKNNVNGFEIKNLESLPEIFNKISNLNSKQYQSLSDNSLKTFTEKFQLETMLTNYHNYILDYVIS